MAAIAASGESVMANIPSGNALVLCGVIGTLFLLNSLLTPRMDPSEPPLLKPSIPLIGHIIGIIWHQIDYHRILYKTYPLRIASLQMLWGKIYAVWDPQLAQASLRARDLSFEPFVVDFAHKSCNLGDETFAKVTSNPALVPEFIEAIHGSMQPTHLHSMSIIALHRISRILDEIPPNDSGGLTVPNLYLWTRDLISLATMRALLGKQNPFDNDPSLVEDLWAFETSLPDLLTKPFPSITARRGFLARNRLQSVLGKYYAAKHDLGDPTAAEITRRRANVLRKYGFSGEEVAKLEVMLQVVGTTNSAPTQYWLICHVFADSDLVSRLREEALPLLERNSEIDTHVMTVNITRLETDCPLLISCYQETLRLVNQGMSVRRVLEDTIIHDGKGKEYILKKGIDVQISCEILHKMPSVWGSEALEFDPERFLATPSKSPDQVSDDKAKKSSYIPFGGGRHLCPGRNFAFAEILALTCALVVGFELETIDLDFNQMETQPAKFGTAIVKPKNHGKGQGIKLRRRKRWENEKWRFKD